MAKKKKDVEDKKQKVRKTQTVKSRKMKRSEKNYSLESLKKALDAVGKGGSIREIANRFGVPKSTLHIKLQNHYPLECKKGPPTVLTESEEDEVVKWILYCAERGFPVTKEQLLDCVQRLII